MVTNIESERHRGNRRHILLFCNVLLICSMCLSMMPVSNHVWGAIGNVVKAFESLHSFLFCLQMLKKYSTFGITTFVIDFLFRFIVKFKLLSLINTS